MKKFFKVFFITVGVLATLFFILFILLIMNLGTLLQDKTVALKSNQYLKIDLSKPIPEMPVEEMDRIFNKSKYNFYQCLDAIHKAGKNDKIIGIYLKVTNSTLGWAQSEELVRALQEFKKEKKPVYAYFDDVSDKEYVLASVADKVYCSPQALVFLDGLNAQMAFYKDMFKKIGIEFQTVRHGKYKSAVEPFVQNTISQENRQMITDMLMSISKDYKSMIQSNRKLDSLDTIVANGPYLLIDEIKKLNLVDSVVLEDNFYDAIGIDKKNVISIEDFINVPSPIKVTSDKKIALVLAEGDIISGKRKKEMITDQGLITDLKKAFEDKNIAGIVLRVNSPGGSGGASDNIWQYIEAHKSEKPLVVSMGNLAASGGYYISMNSQKIFSDRTTLTGSIGVFFLKPILTGLMDKLDLTIVSINTDPHADFFASVDTLKSYEKEKITQYIDVFYDQFISNVGAGRKKSKEQIDSIGQGRVWTGSQAQSNGLVDEIGGMMEAIAEAKKLAGIPEGETVNVMMLPVPRDIINQFMDEELGDFLSQITYVRLLKDVVDMKTRGEIMTRLPYRIDVE